MSGPEDDVAAIRGLLADGFAAISWSPTTPPDWARFFGSYIKGATLFPAARPVVPTAPEPFRIRMDEQRAGGSMIDFEETMLGSEIRVFGKIAVATAAFRARVNKTGEGAGVNMYLLVKEGDGWRIAAVAWDNASDQNPIPASLRS